MIKSIDLIEKRLWLALENRTDLDYIGWSSPGQQKLAAALAKPIPPSQAILSPPLENHQIITSTSLSNFANRVTFIKEIRRRLSQASLGAAPGLGSFHATSKTPAAVSPPAAQETKSQADELFSDVRICLYFLLLGESYEHMFARRLERGGEPDDSVSLEFIRRSRKALRTAYLLAEEVLAVNSNLYLRCIYQYCHILFEYQNNADKCRHIAARVLAEASDRDILLGNREIYLLQIIRNDFLVEGGRGRVARVGRWKAGPAPAKPSTIWDCFEDEPDDSVDSEASSDDDTFEADVSAKKTRRRGRRETSGPGAGADGPFAMVRYLRRLVSLPVPVLLDTIRSAPEILSALDRIFRAYVRGHALPGRDTAGPQSQSTTGPSPSSTFSSMDRI